MIDPPPTDVKAPLPVAKSALEILATAVVPATVFCYLVGFLASAPHFVRAGVPIYVISPQAFIAAGIICVIFTAPVVLVTLWALNWWKALTRRQKLLTVALGVAFPFVLLWQFLGFDLWPRVILFTLAVQISMLSLSDTVVLSVDRAKLLDTARSISKVALALTVSLGFFGSLLYPVIPLQWGGGRPELLVTVPLGHSHEHAVAAHDGWASTARCRNTDAAAAAERCQLVFRVHESSEYLFVAIVEVPHACSTAPKKWASWPMFGGDYVGCFQRISNTTIPILESSGVP